MSMSMSMHGHELGKSVIGDRLKAESKTVVY